MIANTVPHFETPTEMRSMASMAEQSIESVKVIRRPTKRDNQREWDFESLVLCIILTATIFGAIAVVYFAGAISTEATLPIL